MLKSNSTAAVHAASCVRCVSGSIQTDCKLLRTNIQIQTNFRQIGALFLPPQHAIFHSTIFPVHRTSLELITTVHCGRHQTSSFRLSGSSDEYRTAITITVKVESITVGTNCRSVSDRFRCKSIDPFKVDPSVGIPNQTLNFPVCFRCVWSRFAIQLHLIRKTFCSRPKLRSSCVSLVHWYIRLLVEPLTSKSITLILKAAVFSRTNALLLKLIK